MAGDYTSYRGIQTATVERERQLLQLTQETGVGAETLQLIPERLTPDGYAFYTVTAGGERIPVEFHVDTEPIELSMNRARFRTQ